MKEEQGKKMSPKGELPAGEGEKVPVTRPLSDEDLDTVAGGIVGGGIYASTNATLNIAPAVKSYTIK
jgi:hypothetical protein